MAITRSQFLEGHPFSIPNILGVFKFTNTDFGSIEILCHDDTWMKQAEVSQVNHYNFRAKFIVYGNLQHLKINYSCLNPESAEPIAK